MEKKMKRFFEVAGEISDLRKCLNDLGLFPLMIGRMDKKLEDKIKKTKKRLPKFTKKERDLILHKYKYDIMDLEVCFCGGIVRKLDTEAYCEKCGVIYYEN